MPVCVLGKETVVNTSCPRKNEFKHCLASPYISSYDAKVLFSPRSRFQSGINNLHASITLSSTNAANC